MKPLPPLEPFSRRFERETFEDFRKKNREKLRLELAREIRAGNDLEVQRILTELGPLAVEMLDELDDHGLAAGNWGVER